MSSSRSFVKRPSRASGTPTVADVAQRAGVSAMTVSRALNEPWRVREETRSAVMRAVDALRYVPNAAARRLAGSREIRFGLLLNDLGAGFLSAVLMGCMSAASRNHVQILMEDADASGDPLIGTANLIAAKVDGVILPPPLGEDARVIALLDGAKIPMVALTASMPDARTLAVHIDDDRAAEAMTRHLLSLGHRRIAFVGGAARSSASVQRLDGYRRALASAGIASDPGMVMEGDFTYPSGLEAAERLFASDQPPTAVFACNDDMAAAVIAVAHRLGLDVPADVAVCGFDDTVLATAIWPQLTTIRQPLVDMTKEAVSMLLEQVSTPGGLAADRRHRVFEYELIRRQSDAAPRRRPTHGLPETQS
ncbi:LacI family DNA-binding transcriptional regulator [Sphingomonas sp. KR1UV-12]|uniref:LacI family DNA-binding transcriptional regulator n=1 Tax=Sphingomonas aurea TaxID=3063994 RepID=A0ABT9EKW2_9SPHN|nr:LacI family DNA-binding transcriptional regulator [Sphingomonas sp. KR1UV-12]MDP1027574.1 LacI family DNA-binding transcriptional regulator [Sphingomonas sp. KR1UV-12]